MANMIDLSTVLQEFAIIKDICEKDGQFMNENAVFELLEEYHVRNFASDKIIKEVLKTIRVQNVNPDDASPEVIDRETDEIFDYSATVKTESPEVIRADSVISNNSDNNSIIEVEVPKRVFPVIDLTDINSPKSGNFVSDSANLSNENERSIDCFSNNEDDSPIQTHYPTDNSSDSDFYNSQREWNRTLSFPDMTSFEGDSTVSAHVPVESPIVSSSRPSNCSFIVSSSRPSNRSFIVSSSRPSNEPTGIRFDPFGASTSRDFDRDNSNLPDQGEMLEENNNDPNNNTDGRLMDDGNLIIEERTIVPMSSVIEDQAKTILQPIAGCSKDSTPPASTPGSSKGSAHREAIENLYEAAMDVINTDLHNESEFHNDAATIKEIIPWADMDTIVLHLKKYGDDSSRKQRTLWDLMKDNNKRNQEDNSNASAPKRHRQESEPCPPNNKILKLIKEEVSDIKESDENDVLSENQKKELLEPLNSEAFLNSKKTETMEVKNLFFKPSPRMDFMNILSGTQEKAVSLKNTESIKIVEPLNLENRRAAAILKPPSFIPERKTNLESTAVSKPESKILRPPAIAYNNPRVNGNLISESTGTNAANKSWHSETDRIMTMREKLEAAKRNKKLAQKNLVVQRFQYFIKETEKVNNSPMKMTIAKQPDANNIPLAKQFTQIYQVGGQSINKESLPEVIPVAGSSKNNEGNSKPVIKSSQFSNRDVYVKLREMFPHVEPGYVQNLCINPPMSYNNSDHLKTLLIDHLLEKGNDHLYIPDIEYQEQEIPASVSVDEQYENILLIFKDIDPIYLRKFVEENYKNKEKLEEFIVTNLDKKSYPTKEQYLQRCKITEQQKQYTVEFNIKKFLEIFPNPFEHFEARKSSQYHAIAFEFLKNLFSKNKINTISSQYRKNHYNITLTAKALAEIGPDMKTKRGQTNDLPTEDIPLLQEMAFVKHRNDIKNYIQTLKIEEEQLFNDLREKNLLLECQCCFNDECLPAKTSTCNQGTHVFCNECIVRGTDNIMGQGETRVKCFVECPSEFSLSTLQAVLAPTVFSALLKKRQEAEVLAAGIEGLESCPFCHFATIPAPEDKIFKCLNTDCMKESCRSCKELSHVPLKCNEVIKTDRARLMIEETMTKVLLRTCYRCKTPFVKDEGCNKMKCTCGAIMCYLCDKPVTGYDHFNAQGSQRTDLCPLWSDDKLLHAKAVQVAAEQMEKEIRRNNPNLKIDTQKLIPKLPPKSKGPHNDIPNADRLPDHVLAKIAEARQ